MRHSPARQVQRIKADYVVIGTAPNDRSLGAASAISDLVLVPCTPSGLDLEATIRTLEIVDAVRVPPHGVPHLILVPNRVDRRTLEGKQLIDELIAFGERVSPPIGNRTAFIRAFSTGFPIAGWAGELAYGEIRALTEIWLNVFSTRRPPMPDDGFHARFLPQSSAIG